jgi:hypothetical protein
MTDSAADWDAVFLAPIPDALIFAVCDEVRAFRGISRKGFWDRVRATPSWDSHRDIRAIITIILQRLPEDVLDFLRPRRRLRNEEEAVAESTQLCEAVHAGLQEIGEFMRIGPRPQNRNGSSPT